MTLATPTQLTFQGLLDALGAVPQDAIVMLSGFGSGSSPGVLFRHRPFVDGLSITPTIARAALQTTAAEYADFMRRTGPGLTSGRFVRAGFVDQHPAGADSPMWAGFLHTPSFNAVTGVEMVKGFAVIRTTNLAPEQGPPLQRVPDDEVINRMRVANIALHGEDIRLAPEAERHLMRYIPKDRTTVLQRLAEARHDLITFEASLQAKKDLVTKLERNATRHDYLLGIRDDLPGAKEGCNGICLRASDVGVSVPGDPVARAHDSCPEHGRQSD